MATLDMGMPRVNEAEVLRRTKRGLPGRQIAYAFVLRKPFGTDLLAAVSRLAAD